VAKRRIPIWFLVGLAIAGLIATAVVGVFLWTSATATQLHPDPQGVPSVASADPPQRWAAAADRARAFARASVSDLNLPGLSIAVGVDGEIVWAEGFGLADLGSHDLDFSGQLALGDAVVMNPNRVGVTPETRFRIVGVSMALTSAAVGLLVEQGRLKLDEDIHVYVPAFPAKQWPVTVRQLMAHQGGIQNDGGDEAPLMARCERTIDGLALDDFAGHPLRFPPGTDRRYSTYGWILVSAAVEAAAEEPFFSFMRSRVFEPLGMHDTTPESWTEPIRNRATFYFPRFGGDTRYGPDLAREGDHACFAGAGAFLSTPSDLVRFGMAITSGALLRPETVRMLQTSLPLASGAETGTGLGWTLETVSLAGEPTRVARQDDRRSVGGSTTLLTFPDRGLVVAVTANITFVDTPAIALAIAEMFAEQRADPAGK
jgi:serine beta-lactamase-like protein LACTB